MFVLFHCLFVCVCWFVPREIFIFIPELACSACVYMSKLDNNIVSCLSVCLRFLKMSIPELACFAHVCMAASENFSMSLEISIWNNILSFCSFVSFHCLTVYVFVCWDFYFYSWTLGLSLPLFMWIRCTFIHRIHLIICLFDWLFVPR